MAARWCIMKAGTAILEMGTLIQVIWDQLALIFINTETTRSLEIFVKFSPSL